MSKSKLPLNLRCRPRISEACSFAVNAPLTKLWCGVSSVRGQRALKSKEARNKLQVGRKSILNLNINLNFSILVTCFLPLLKILKLLSHGAIVLSAVEGKLTSYFNL